MFQPHIKCKKGDVADIVFLPGDPGRVERIVKYFDCAKKVAQNREFLIYSGEYKKIPVSVCSTGVGCPSAAIAVEELANIGAKIFIRIGTCGGLKKNIKPGDIIIPTGAIRAEGTTSEYVANEFPAVADFEVTTALIKSAQARNIKYFTGINRTHDAFYEHVDNLAKWASLYKDKRRKKWNIPLVSSEMECSAIFIIALLRGLKAGAILSVNTTEPLDDNVKDHSEDIYELIETSQTKSGVDQAIQTALNAVEILKKDGLF